MVFIFLVYWVSLLVIFITIAVTDNFYLSVHEFYGKDVATLITGGFF